jgi:hypothetical protein
VTAITAPLGPPDIGGVAGRTVSHRVHTLAERFLDHVGHLDRHHVGAGGELVYAITVNAAFPRRVLEEVGGFDEAFPFPSGEDMDLGFRIRARGYRLVVTDAALVRHRQRETLPALWRTWFLYGRGAYMCARRNPTVATGGVTSGRLLEPRKVAATLGRAVRTLGGHLRDPALRSLEALAFPTLEVGNHVCYQLGRLYERLRGDSRSM